MINERKATILKAIVGSYIKFAEPVGSMSLAKQYDLGISSATIRNEMSELEKLGYLTKIHTSSGRIPSDKAYRFYVNLLSKNGFDENKDVQNHIKEEIESEFDSDDLYKKANKVLTKATNYLTIIISPVDNFYTIKYLKIDKLDEDRILVILVGNMDESITDIIMCKNLIDLEEIENYEQKIKNLLINKSKNEIQKSKSEIDKSDLNFELTEAIMNLALSFFKKHEDYRLYLNGVSNILDFTESENPEDIKELLQFVEDRDRVTEILIEKAIDDILNVRIGNENTYEALKNFSILTSKYYTPNNFEGNVSIIGPTRMDYGNLLNLLMNFSATLSELNRL